MSGLRDTLRALLALPAPGPAPQAAMISSTPVAHGYTREEWIIGKAPATLLRPGGDNFSLKLSPPASVLYCHAHGGAHALGRRELCEGARWLTGPYAPDLMARGVTVLCLDMPGFGERMGMGSESALAKAALWRGQPLFGRMLEDLQAAVTWLTAQSTAPIATLGMSMGAAHAFWLAALDTRISACAHIAMLANMAPLIASGTHDRHGHFLTVPGLLKHADMGDVAALIAPRPQCVALGDGDHLTPPEARDPALARLRAAYAPGTPLDVRVFPADTHIETPAMRAHVLSFLDRWTAGVADQPQKRNTA
ncbi:alpha/beta hydrolase family protein [Tropicibacter sp. S64]|uniref:alpha/beta hydrolase family protein n=1 Tax=Tropicibacter sp. S64 TaxID=3415122 RepID=UPI003C7A8351